MWKFTNSFTGNGYDQQTSPNTQYVPTQSWYPSSSVGSSPASSHLSTPGNMQHRDRIQSPAHGHASPAEAARIIACLKDKSVDELRKLLNDPDAYEIFFQSLEQVKTQNHVRDELQKETLHLARDNLEKEPRILELRNQCMIIRTTELAAAQEKLNELERQKEEILRLYSPGSLIQKLHDEMEKTEEESEALHKQLLNGEIDMAFFIQNYKKHRTLYHKRALVHLSAKAYV